MRIAVLDDYQNVALRLADWESIGADAEIAVFNEHMSDEGALATALVNFDIVVLMRERTPFPASLIEKLPNLKLLISTGARNRSIDLEVAVNRGIIVCGTPLIPHPPAELTWALILAIVKDIPAEDAAMRQGKWQTRLGRTLKGKTLGIVGLGNLGGQTALIGQAFGMEIIAWSQNLTDARAAEFGAKRVALDTLMSTADVVTIHLYLSQRTIGVIGRQELSLMKPSAYLVNTARSPIIDEAALIDVLQNRKIAGAALDVFDVEPLPLNHPFRTLDNTIVTPHVGYVTEEGLSVMYGGVVENIRAYREGRPVQQLRV
jgi:phosphoglycerate dehydrogenase-like enzyme